MQTVITEDIAAAAEFIRRGGTAAFPTETVYGLGADAFDASAVAKIFAAKGRPADNPLIVHCADIEQVAEVAAEINADAAALMKAFFPGPLTLVLKKSERVPAIVSAGLETVGVRVPRLRAARKFIKACGVPLAAPSANVSGRPSPTTWQAVFDDLDGRVDCILKGEIAEIGLESTVVDCSGDAPVVLRHGAVSLEMLRTIVPETNSFLRRTDAAPKSPGMRHKHYSPNARVEIFGGGEGFSVPERAAFIGLRPPGFEFEVVEICPTAEIYAARLFAFFRECDAAGIETIFCEPVEESGIGRALMDRIKRAAEG